MTGMTGMTEQRVTGFGIHLASPPLPSPPLEASRPPAREPSTGGGGGRGDRPSLCLGTKSGESPGEVPSGACAAPRELPGPPPPPSESAVRRRNGALVTVCTAQVLSPCARRSFFLRRVPAGRKGRRGALRQHTARTSCVRPLPPHRPDFSSSPSALRLRRQLERSEVFGDAQDVFGHLGHAARHLHVPVPLYRSCRHPRRTPFCSKA